MPLNISLFQLRYILPQELPYYGRWFSNRPCPSTVRRRDRSLNVQARQEQAADQSLSTLPPLLSCERRTDPHDCPGPSRQLHPGLPGWLTVPHRAHGTPTRLPGQCIANGSCTSPPGQISFYEPFTVPFPPLRDSGQSTGGPLVLATCLRPKSVILDLQSSSDTSQIASHLSTLINTDSHVSLATHRGTMSCSQSSYRESMNQV